MFRTAIKENHCRKHALFFLRYFLCPSLLAYYPIGVFSERTNPKPIGG
uniref:Uncharacterized protein n=1 Tax=Anguilla anguilla TaxID=7936 RepID=A0A0E9UK77_ANGAN